MIRTLYLTWQDPNRRKWFPIGRLRSDGRQFEFVYTRGALGAVSEAGFTPLAAFPDLSKAYTAAELFPLFQNRLLPQSRPDYKNYLGWLSMAETEHDPVVILARSGGQRATDSLEITPCPERLPSGEFTLVFLVHGLRYMPPESAQRVDHLEKGERLLLMKDFQNPVDKDAIALRSAEKHPNDMHLLGYCPRYLRPDFERLLEADSSATVTVERVNPPPAPVQFRLLCRLTVRWPDGFTPFSTPDYLPLVHNYSMSVG